MVIGSKLCEKDIFEVCFIITHVEKNIFLKNQKKVNFSKPAAAWPPAGCFELFQTGGFFKEIILYSGLGFGDLVSEKVKNLKMELFERFSIKIDLADV